MRKLLLPLILAGVLLVVVFSFSQRARGQGPDRPDGQVLLKSETEGESVPRDLCSCR